MAVRDVHLLREPADAGAGRRAGAQLRRARERRGLSLEDVAAALHLDRGTISAVEQDAWEQLPPATFARGYYRAYARFLDLPEDGVLDALDGGGLEGERRPLQARVGALAPSRRGSWFPGLMLALLAAGVVGSTLWYRQQLLTPAAEPAAVPAAGAPEPPAVATRRTVPQVEAVETSPAAPANAVPEVPRPAVADAPPPAVEDSPEPAAAVAPAADSGETPPPVTAQAEVSAAQTGGSPGTAGTPEPRDAAMAEAPASGPAVDAPLPAQPASERTPAQPAVAQPAQAESGPAPREADAGRATTASEPLNTQPLELSLAGPSWVEVVDARGERLIYGLLSAGSQRTVSGVPPISVVIGDAAVAELRYRGDDLPLQDHTRGKVARVTLGEGFSR